MSRIAFADGKAEVTAKLKAAMEAYDTFDYDGARKQLDAAIAVAKKSHLDKDPILAKAYLDLGIVAAAVPDQGAEKSAFVSACQIDPKIQIDVAYKSPELSKILEMARGEAKSGGGGGGGGGSNPSTDDPLAAITASGGGGDCSSVKGLDHTLVDTAKGGAPLQLEAQLGSDVKASKVSIHFRVEGSTEFTEIKMTKQGDCKYVGTIPSSAMKGSLVHYYIAAYDGGGTKPVASKGSAGSPNIIEVTAGGGGGGGAKGDDEDPLGGSKKATVTVASSTGDNTQSDVESHVSVPGKPKKVWIGVNGGTSGGYVTGTTEGLNMVKNCCLGSSLGVLVGELGYNVNPQVSLAVAFRMGLPIGANLDGHATGAPSGLVRLRYALSEQGEGVHVMGQLGFGFVRNTIKLDDPAMGMDTDIVAQGPLLVGGGVGYLKKINNSVAFTADLDVLAGIAVKSTIGISPMNNGISGDVSIGLEFGLF